MRHSIFAKGNRMTQSNAALGMAGEPIREIDVLWMNAGLSCDGDTIAMTAATQPSIEDLVRGGLPWIPKVNFHNLFLAYENGDGFMERFHRAANGTLAPFILVVEGSIPNEGNDRRILGVFRNGPRHGTAHHHLRMDRPAGAEGLGDDRRGNLRDLWRNSRHGRQSHRLHGTHGLSGMAVEIDARFPRQIHALPESATGIAAVFQRRNDLRPRHPCATAVYVGFAE
jgi:hypothetical protein